MSWHIHAVFARPLWEYQGAVIVGQPPDAHCCSAGSLWAWRVLPPCSPSLNVFPKMTGATTVSWGACSLASLQEWLGLRIPPRFRVLSDQGPAHTYQFTALWAACSSWPWDFLCKQHVHPFFFFTEYRREIQLCSSEAGWGTLCKSTWVKIFQSFSIYLFTVLSFSRLSSKVPLPFPETEMYTPTIS